MRTLLFQITKVLIFSYFNFTVFFISSTMERYHKEEDMKMKLNKIIKPLAATLPLTLSGFSTLQN